MVSSSYLYPNSPGTFIQSIEMAAQTVVQGAKTGCIIGEVDVAYKAPTLMEPVFVTSIAALQVAFNYGSDAGANYYANPLFEQAKRHLLAGGGGVYVIPVGPVGTFLVTPTWNTGPDVCAAVANYTHAGSHSLTAGDWEVCLTEYKTSTHLVTHGETLPSVIKTVTVPAPSGVSGEVAAIHVKHTHTNSSAGGISVYVRQAGGSLWFFAGDVVSAADLYIIDDPTGADLKEPPLRNEALVSQTAAPLTATLPNSSWDGGMDAARGLYDVSSICIAGGYDFNNASPSVTSNRTLMSMAAQHAEDASVEAYNKRLAIAPAAAAETHSNRIDPTFYGDLGAETNAFITSDRLLKVGLNGTEGYVSGAFCARTYMQGITYYPVPSCPPSETFAGGNAYPLMAAQRDAEFANGWILLKPFEDGVRVLRGITAIAASTANSNIFSELFVRTVIDYLLGQIERHGDAFIGSAVAINTQEQRMSLQADIRGVLVSMIRAFAIADADCLVLPNKDGIKTAVDVALSVTVNHEIETIFVYATLGG